MELRHLRYFIAVAEDLNISRAAVRLGIAQPPLSQCIRQLEEEIGFPLFYRLSRGVALTDAGRQFLVDAYETMAHVSQSLVNAKCAAEGEFGMVRIGFTGSASFNPIVTGAIRDFRIRYPAVKVELIEETTTNLIGLLRSSRIDTAFFRPGAGEATDLKVWLLYQEEMLIALPSSHPLAEEDDVLLAALRDESFILFPRSNGRSLYDSIILSCREAGFNPKIEQAAPQMASTVNLVATGIGVSIVPGCMAQLHPQGVVYKKIRGHGPRADMCLSRRISEGAQATKNFTELVLRRTPPVRAV